MSSQPRFQAEFFIRQNIEELQNFANVFNERIATAFDGLDAEAERIQHDEYDRLAASGAGPYDDDSGISETAYFKGVDHYLAIDAVRQGIFNLMVAGIYHLLEQQAQHLSVHVLSDPRAKPEPDFGIKQLRGILNQQFGIEVTVFGCWPLLDRLRLIANVIKHGDGDSADELRTLDPNLFKDPGDPLPPFANHSLRPLVGEGLRLTANHFNAYKNCVEQFWNELTLALLPHFCRQ